MSPSSLAILTPPIPRIMSCCSFFAQLTATCSPFPGLHREELPCENESYLTSQRKLWFNLDHTPIAQRLIFLATVLVREGLANLILSFMHIYWGASYVWDIELGYGGYKEGKGPVSLPWLTVYWGNEVGKQVNYSPTWKRLIHWPILGLMEIKICRNLSLEGVRSCKTPGVGTTFTGQLLLGKLAKTSRKTAHGLWGQLCHVDSKIVIISCNDVHFGLPD